MKENNINEEVSDSPYIETFKKLAEYQKIKDIDISNNYKLLLQYIKTDNFEKEELSLSKYCSILINIMCQCCDFSFTEIMLNYYQMNYNYVYLINEILSFLYLLFYLKRKVDLDIPYASVFLLSFVVFYY